MVQGILAQLLVKLSITCTMAASSMDHIIQYDQSIPASVKTVLNYCCECLLHISSQFYLLENVSNEYFGKKKK